MLRKMKKGQTAIEYVVLLVVVIGSLMTIQNYLKRGVQGRLRDAVDSLGDQYDPRTAVSFIEHTLSSETTTDIMALDSGDGYWTKRTDTSSSIEKKKGAITVGAY